MVNTHIPVVLGTAREGRMSEPVARYVVSVLEGIDGMTTELVDIRDHITAAVTMPPWGKGGADEHPTTWKEIIARTDALILVIPEYNHGYPGELKLLLDSLWPEYKGRAVGICGVSAGSLGAARVIDHIKPVLIEMHLVPIREAVGFSKVKGLFNEDGSIKDNSSEKYLHSMVDELRRYARLLAPLRGKTE